MKILALETSTPACSVALIEGSRQDYSCIERFQIAPRQHTHLILPMIDSVLAEAGYDIRQMDVLAFGRGPGAFTGVRVATGVVQAISYGADLPVAQISSLAAIAQAAHTQYELNKVLVANDARMDEIYFGAYELKEGFMTLSGKEQVLKPEQLFDSLAQSSTSIHADESWYSVGNGWEAYKEQLGEVSSLCLKLMDSELEQSLELPHAKDIAYLGFKEVETKSLVQAEQVCPVYLRDDVAKKSKQTVSMV